MVRLMIADEQVSYQQTLQLILQGQTNIQDIWLAPTAEQALTHLQTTQTPVDILLLSLQNKQGKPIGLYYAKYIREQFPHLKLIVYSSFRTGKLVHEMKGIKAQGFFFKNSPLSDLLRTIRIVSEGGTHFSSEALELLERYLNCFTPSHDDPPSQHEYLILKYLHQSCSLAEIASKMEWSILSVEILVKFLIHKYRVSSIASDERGYAKVNGILPLVPLRYFQAFNFQKLRSFPHNWNMRIFQLRSMQDQAVPALWLRPFTTDSTTITIVLTTPQYLL